jgi:dihydroorotate dehydrogenase electron transfer subunit
VKKDELFSVFKLKEVHSLNYRTSTFVFDKPLPKTQPGQFVMVWLPEVGEKPFSIAGADPFSLTVAAVGPFSEAMCGLELGARVWIRGPLGHGYRLSGKRHLLVGGGYGAAPLYFLAQQALAQGDALHVCLGARSTDDLILVEDFRSAGCEVAVTTDDGSQGQHGRVSLAVEQAVKEFQPQTLYACGPQPMLMALVEQCKKHHLPAQLSWEAMMRCGIGLCGSCELDEETTRAAGLPGGWLTCKDGPVSFNDFA